MFSVSFVLDVDAMASLSGRLYSEPGPGFVPNGYDEVQATAFFGPGFNAPLVSRNLYNDGEAAEVPFSFDGFLPAGSYTIQVYSSLIPALDTADRPLTVGWSLRFDVQAVPEPSLAAFAAIALTVAGTLRAWTRRSSS